MAIVRCEKQHYYDDTKFSKCPYCMTEEMEDDQPTVTLYDDKTERELGDLDVKTVSLYETQAPEGDGDLTIRGNEDSDLTVGWLVCVGGGSKGRDYRIVSGRNMVGRSYSMAICIQGDESISRENHCAVIYDDKHNAFYLMPVNNVVYIGEKLLSGAVELKTGDQFMIGDSQFVFVAFCEGDRAWKNY